LVRIVLSGVSMSGLVVVLASLQVLKRYQ